LSERDLLRGAPVDLRLRLEALAGRYRGPGEINSPARDRIRTEGKRLAKGAPRTDPTLDSAQLAALAYPDRVAQRRPETDPRYLLSGGKGAALRADDPLAAAPYLVVTDTDGHPREARIRLALPITEAQIREAFHDRITEIRLCDWSRREGRVLARLQDRLGALVLSDAPWPNPPGNAVARAMLEGVRELGLTFSDAARRFRARVMLARGTRPDLPDLSDAALMETLDSWLLPHLTGLRSAADWRAFDLLPALEALLDWPARQALDQIAPAQFTSPLGRRIPIDYADGVPAIALRLQEMLGCSTHPQVAGRALQITLLSPAGRPLQTTTDLPGFWAGSYADLRKDMRGRHPRHPWPEDPTQAEATLRAKPKAR